MKIRLPTDVDIMDALSDGERNTAANLAYLIDKERTYINTRLPVLADYGLVERVGPAPNSGLYVITDDGISLLGRIRDNQESGAKLRPAVDDHDWSESPRSPARESPKEQRTDPSTVHRDGNVASGES